MRRSLNPYKARINAVLDRQRIKGVETYGQGIEKNNADTVTRLDYLQEELADAMMYVEWIKDRFTPGKWIDMEGQADPSKPWMKLGKGYLRCEKCGRVQFLLYEKNFCPSCGKDMRGKVGE